MVKLVSNKINKGYIFFIGWCRLFIDFFGDYLKKLCYIAEESLVIL